MEYRFHTADVFTDRIFGGNQLAIVVDARGLTDELMASIAREFNFSETVFVLPPRDAANTRSVRIFTPGSELPFAGHPTIGCAIVLAETGEIEIAGAETRIVLEEGVGPVAVVIRSENGKPVSAQLTSAQLPSKGVETYDSAAVAAAVSLEAGDIDTSASNAIEAWTVGLPYLFIPVRTRDALARSRIRMDAWERNLRNTWAPEVFLFVRDGDVIRARMFAPTLGIAEDPATGSAVGGLSGYLAARSSVRDGTIRETILQGVEMGRPSRMELEIDVADGVVTAVRVGGASVLVSSGTLFVP